MNEPRPLGLPGRLAGYFLNRQLTPLLALIALLAGVFAVLVTPREEEPQIDVTFANVYVPFPGATAAQVESLVATPLEQVLAEIAGVKHIASASRPGLAVITLQFEVGERRTEALVRLYNAIYANRDWRPAGLGVMEPLVKPGSIDDVPILTLTLWREGTDRGAAELGQVARSLEAEVRRVPGTRDVYTIGAPARWVRVELDPGRLAAHGLSLAEVAGRLQAANLSRQAGALQGPGGVQPLTVGSFLADATEVAGLVVGMTAGKPVYLSALGNIDDRPGQPESYVWFGTGAAGEAAGLPAVDDAPAVTLAVAKKPGENAIDVAARV
ncbi:MAG: efflux RND transporter permease subunit, partial [Gammaproteobacteria bacterium]